jgi:putative DNA primase/helicase
MASAALGGFFTFGGQRLHRRSSDGRGHEVNVEEHHTDLGNARRLVQLHGADMRHCAARKSWFVWDGKRWAPDETGEAMRRAKDTVRSMFRRAVRELAKVNDIQNDAERKAAIEEAELHMAFAIRSESRHRLEAMLKLAETELPMPVTIPQLDADPWLLNVRNGTLDLRTGAIREHRRKDMITRIAGADYDSAARDERWAQFLEQAMPDEDVRRYVQRALGYSLTGTGAEGGIFLPYGPTHTGKTTLLEAVRAALGTYAVTMDVSTLTGRAPSAGSARSDIVRLFGSRFVVSTEVPAGVKLDEALVKKLTGGDSLAARALYQAEQEASGTFVIWLGSNYRPSVRDDDDAVWERVRQIPFQQQHAGKHRDKSLKPYLESEARAVVLAWLVEGAVAYAAEGLEAPAAVRSLTEDYRREMNPLWTWAEECCELAPEATSTYVMLRSSYEDFTRRGDRPVGTRRFTNSLKTLRGVTYDHRTHTYYGIRVHDGFQPEDVDRQFRVLVERF